MKSNPLPLNPLKGAARDVNNFVHPLYQYRNPGFRNAGNNEILHRIRYQPLN